MTEEDFYGPALAELRRAEVHLLDMARSFAETACQEGQIRPIVYCCSRIKTPESVLHKCSLRGLEQSVQAALENLYDLVGIRIIVAFSADVYRVADWLKSQPEICIAQEKDYYAFPKPNGYRSYHVLLNLLPEGTPAEIQIRTIATDFWATLEHQIKYKRKIPNEKLIREELKLCADEIASVELSMQTIREIIQNSISSAEQNQEE